MLTYLVSSPSSDERRTITTDSPLRAAVRYVHAVWGCGPEHRVVHVQIGESLPAHMMIYELTVEPVKEGDHAAQ